ncbi:hypothetical protein WN944_001324 [Citrus x changshan-huyou]|uniref:Ubiquitin-like protease family profile domain-containing protein n=1 Tax=Citrus x changshan-huyou TaxID=2935761 RepID=A0AAP0QUN9_9ROSI
MANDIVGRPFGFIHKGLVSSAHDKDAFAQGFHWLLIVIDITTKQAFYLDSVNNDLGDDNDEGHSYQSPNQPGSTECGYYMLRFIKDIIAYPSLLLHDFKGKCEYLQSELDEVRLEYASFVSELIV